MYSVCFAFAFSAAQAKLLKYAVVKTPRSVYAAIPGRNKFRPSQQTPIANFVLAGARAAAAHPSSFCVTRHHHRPPPALLHSAALTGIIGAASGRRHRTLTEGAARTPAGRRSSARRGFHEPEVPRVHGGGGAEREARSRGALLP